MTTEVLVALFGVVGTVVGGIMYILKRDSDSRAAKTKAEADSLIADANTRATQAEIALRDAEARVQMAKTQEAQIEHMLNLLKEQLKINQEHTRQAESWSEILRQKEKVDERNYSVLRQVSDDNTRYLSEQMVTAARKINEAIEQVPARIEMLNVDAVKIMAREIGQQVAAEVGGQIVKLLAEWKTAPAECPEKKAVEAGA